MASGRGLALLVGVVFAACSANDDIPAPIVSSVVPDHAPVGTIVVVNGSYFCQRPGSGSAEDPTCPSVVGTVRFGAVPGTPSSYTDVAIMVEVPLGLSGSADVSVTAGGRTSNSVAFTAM
jgi:hypothetical protein